MNIRNQEYWEERALEKDEQFYQDADTAIKELGKAYKQAERELSNKLSSFITKYSKDKELTYAETQRVMNTKETADFRYSIGEYMERIEETGSKELLRELDIMSGKARYKVIDDIMTEVRVQSDILGSEEFRLTQEHLENTIEGNYYQTAYEIQKGMNLYYPIKSLPISFIETSLNYPWSGSMFSDRIWRNKASLEEALRESITQGLIQGKSYRSMTQDLQSKLGSNYYNANRIITTETNHIIEQSNNRTYKELGITHYIIVATLDRITSQICRNQDGKKYELSKHVTGVTAPPFHPNCRTTTAPFVDGQLQERMERKHGKSNVIESDKNITYKTWEKNYAA